MKREAWASQTTATSSFVCWPCTMPVSRHSYEEPYFSAEKFGGSENSSYLCGIF